MEIDALDPSEELAEEDGDAAGVLVGVRGEDADRVGHDRREHAHDRKGDREGDEDGQRARELQPARGVADGPQQPAPPGGRDERAAEEGALAAEERAHEGAHAQTSDDRLEHVLEGEREHERDERRAQEAQEGEEHAERADAQARRAHLLLDDGLRVWASRHLGRRPVRGAGAVGALGGWRSGPCEQTARADDQNLLQCMRAVACMRLPTRPPTQHPAIQPQT